LLENLDARPLGATLDRVEGRVDDALGEGFLAAHHDDVDELGDDPVVIPRVRQEHSLDHALPSWHTFSFPSV